MTKLTKNIIVSIIMIAVLSTTLTVKPKASAIPFLVACVVAINTAAFASDKAHNDSITNKTHYEGELKGNIIKSGQEFPINKRLYSPNRKYYALVQYHGNIVIYNTENNKAKWGSDKGGNAPEKCIMQKDGNLVIYYKKSQNRRPWASNTEGNPGAYLEMTNDGQLRIKNNAKNIAISAWDEKGKAKFLKY